MLDMTVQVMTVPRDWGWQTNRILASGQNRRISVDVAFLIKQRLEEFEL
jgi:hypothetical protein